MNPISGNEAHAIGRHPTGPMAAKVQLTRFGHSAGSALIICLLVLAAITVLAVFGINSSAVQLQIAANHKQMGHGFYLAEGAAMEAAQRISNAPREDLLDHFYFWHHTRREMESASKDENHPQQLPQPGSDTMPALESTLGPNIYLAAVEWGVAPGSSLVATEPRLYLNRIYGKTSRNRADSTIEIGLQKRY